jgi:two-component system, OmpR family, sensor kinase
VSKGTLTKQELGWLLTQEAQGAAERLRQGVQIIRTSMPPAPMGRDGLPLVTTGGDPQHLDATLDALDGVMTLLSSLHQRPGTRSRRGRIDLAALVLELAPEARVALAPGQGTEVFGDEEDIRRMVQVMVGGGGARQVSIKREGDEVRLVVSLGSEGSPTQETERAWLSRMAVRYGGRHELEGDRAFLALPADGVSERHERVALRKELDEAKRQGAAYARELAHAFDLKDERSSSFPALAEPGDAAGRLSEVGRLLAGIAAEAKAAIAPIQSELDTPKANSEEWLETVRRRTAHAVDVLDPIGSFGALNLRELPGSFNARHSVTHAFEALSFRAGRSSVALEFGDEGSEWEVCAPVSLVEWLMKKLVYQAISAAPKETVIRVSFEPEVLGVKGAQLHIDDAGASLSASSRSDLLALRVDPLAIGRGSGVTYALAAQLAVAIGGGFELADVPAGSRGVRVTVILPKRVERN